MKQEVTYTDETMLPPGARVKKCRIAAGYTQEKLIEKIMELPENRGKERNVKHLSAIERGVRNLSIEYAKLLSKVLNVREEYLLGYDIFKTKGERMLKDLEDFDRQDACLKYLISELGVTFEYSGTDYWDIRRIGKNHITQTGFEDLRKPKGKMLKEVIGTNSSGKQITLSSDDLEQLYNDILWYIKYRVQKEFE